MGQKADFFVASPFTVNLNIAGSSLPGGSKNSENHGFPDWRRSWKKEMLVRKASEVAEEQIVN